MQYRRDIALQMDDSEKDAFGVVLVTGTVVVSCQSPVVYAFCVYRRTNSGNGKGKARPRTGHEVEEEV